MSKSNDGWTIAAVIGGFLLFCVAVSGNSSSGSGNPDYYDGPQPHCYGDYRLGEC